MHAHRHVKLNAHQPVVRQECLTVTILHENPDW